MMAVVQPGGGYDVLGLLYYTDRQDSVQHADAACEVTTGEFARQSA